MMNLLTISMQGEIDFALVSMLWGFALLLVVCIALFFLEWIPEKLGEYKERKERKRRNKCRRGYVYIEPDRRYR